LLCLSLWSVTLKKNRFSDESHFPKIERKFWQFQFESQTSFEPAVTDAFFFQADSEPRWNPHIPHWHSDFPFDRADHPAEPATFPQ
jgi:hypothetical protein